MLYQYDDPLRSTKTPAIGRRSRRSRVPVYAVAFLMGLFAAAWLLGRDALEPLTIQSLNEAKERWKQAGIRSYDLRFHMHTADYEVEVRSGLVTTVRVNGREPPSATWRNYSVDGLFETLGQELENLTDPAGPFAGATSAVLSRVRFHPKLGYPVRYLRSGGPMGKPAVIEVLVFHSLDSTD